MNERPAQVIRHLLERSFGQEDVPRRFQVAVQLESITELKQGVLKGIRGLSGAAEVQLEFADSSNALLVMPGHETLKANRLSRFMYDNPDYWVSNDFKAFLRVSQSPPGETLEATLRIMNHFVALLRYKGAGEGHRIHTQLDHARLHEKLARIFADSYTGINVAKMATTLMMLCKEFTSDKLYGPVAQRLLEFYDTKAKWIEALREAILRAVKGYKVEEEWVLKGKRLVIPKGTEVIFRTDTYEHASGEVEGPYVSMSQGRFKVPPDLIQKQLGSKYKVSFLDKATYNRRLTQGRY